MNNQELQTKLNNVDINNIKSIVIRTIGLIDVFGKMLIDIIYINEEKYTIEILSPVPTDIITKWLDTNKLLDKTIMYEF